MSHEPYPGTQAILRAIALLKAFSDSQPDLSLTELARAARLHKTTAYRLLTALESEGLVMRTAGDSYRLGPEAIVLGGRALRANDLRSAGRAELELLAAETRETASLEVLVEAQVLILDEAFGGYLVGATHAIGTRWPAHATSTGKLLLAHLAPAELERFLAGPLAGLTPRTITDPAALRLELGRIREQGYATAAEELEPGYVGLSAPVYNHNGQVVAAISLGGPAIRLAPDRLPGLVALLKASAGRISARLGGG